MKKLILIPAVVVGVTGFAGSSSAWKVNTRLEHRYDSLHTKCQKVNGKDACGRNIARDGYGRTYRQATGAELRRAIASLQDQLAPPAPPTNQGATSTQGSTAAQTGPTSAPSNGLTQCIINAESGGNPQAVNGQYMGEGQWDQPTWIADGGGKYGATPLDASKAQQEQVIADQVAKGNTGQWTNYDPC